LICPVCTTNNKGSAQTSYCEQCGTDLQLHYLLDKVRGKCNMKDEKDTMNPSKQSITSKWMMTVHVLPYLIMIMLIVSVLFVSYFFVIGSKSSEAYHAALSAKLSKMQLAQMTDMDDTIREELSLIVDQRNKNKVLQNKLEKLNAQLSTIRQNQRTYSDFTQEVRKHALEDQVEMLKLEVLKLKNNITLMSIDNHSAKKQYKYE